MIIARFVIDSWKKNKTHANIIIVKRLKKHTLKPSIPMTVPLVENFFLLTFAKVAYSIVACSAYSISINSNKLTV